MTSYLKYIQMLLGLTIASLTVVSFWSLSHTSSFLPARYALESFVPSTKPRKFLALTIPPGLVGGYRNQYLRFTSLVVHAIEHNVTDLYLPSLQWSTQLESIGYGTPWHEVGLQYIWNVEHWNQVAARTKSLPRISNDLGDVDAACWTRNWGNTTVLNLSALDTLRYKAGTSLSRYTLPLLLGNSTLNLRQYDFGLELANCTRPIFYGGGKKAGKLWNDYMGHNQRPLFQQVIRRMAAAWRLAAPWKDLSCVQPPYAVLHARIELEMYNHNCGRDMEMNLTRIIEQVAPLLSNVSTLVIAVSQAGMSSNHSAYDKYQVRAAYNRQVLQQLQTQGLTVEGRRVPVQQCGRQTLQDYYNAHPESPQYGSLLESALNFDIARQAHMFVGVHGSSYSTEVWTTRYLEERPFNYAYTQEGLESLTARPRAHENCGKHKKKPKQ